MATLVYRNAMLKVNEVDYSADVAELTLNYASEILDETAMGDDTRIRKGGLKTWSVEATAHADFSAGHLGNVLFALVGTTTCVEVRPQNTCTTVINPSYYGVAVLETFPPQSGTVGALLDFKVTFQSAGTLTRSVAAS